MDYLEIEGKAQLKRFGIPVNESVLLTGDDIPKEIEYPCVLKGQILSGKRGKAGAVRVVKSEEELVEAKKSLKISRSTANPWKGSLPAVFCPSRKNIIWE